MMNKIKTFFNLNCPYKFDITDLTAFIYTICVIGVMLGADMTILFCVGATIATFSCWQAHKINLMVLNIALWVMNVWSLFQMMMGC